MGKYRTRHSKSIWTFRGWKMQKQKSQSKEHSSVNKRRWGNKMARQTDLSFYPMHGLFNILSREIVLLEIAGNGSADLRAQVMDGPEPGLYMGPSKQQAYRPSRSVMRILCIVKRWYIFTYIINRFPTHDVHKNLYRDIKEIKGTLRHPRTQWLC